jgi:hypothetical protein
MSRRCCFSTSPTSPSTCIRQHTSACVCIRQHTSACCLSTSPTSPSTCIRSIRQHAVSQRRLRLPQPAAMHSSKLTSKVKVVVKHK